MTIMKKAIAIVAILMLTLFGLVAMPKAAYAGDGNCALGNACIWQHTNYNGNYYGQSANESSVSSLLNNAASSAAANGKACYATRFYDNGAQATGSYFILNSKYRTGQNYRDPNLVNGAGLGPYNTQNWNDRISRIKFTGC